MSRNVGRIFAAPRKISTPCRPAAGSRSRPQWRSLSAAAQAQQSPPPSSAPAHPSEFRAASSNSASARRQAAAVSPEEHLNTLFAPLKFPRELADRMLTHSSHPDARIRHNARLTFMGRRVMQFYLYALLDSSPSLRQDHDFEHMVERALNTYILGEHVGAAWSLGKALKWSPPSNSMDTSEASVRSVGLHKVLGGAVEAIVGGVNHQFGGVAAQRLFHTRVLPHLLLRGTSHGLNDAFHEHAITICERFGGLNADLTGFGAKGAQ
ncbi:ribonuclease-III-like-domain-containing protein [Fomitopsis serialis]|uniref:ribonuclease-III-like-domain-containing protein n=1 Tax=Fomitopsis serialis TaxID=139415 RepID=UPI002008CE9C|nr:ribonuclease-III-like-domain-containing protein [Neoantrodia serialis]KAH9931590.1 ribonuclease-III-like-domain-containing protein [Neoantrodia serialis]